eukprot:4679396-Pyramimonas_sp.AAC.1
MKHAKGVPIWGGAAMWALPVGLQVEPTMGPRSVRRVRRNGAGPPLGLPLRPQVSSLGATKRSTRALAIRPRWSSL